VPIADPEIEWGFDERKTGRPCNMSWFVNHEVAPVLCQPLVFWFVIPAHAGIQTGELDSRLRGNDGLLAEWSGDRDRRDPRSRGCINA
jgi:hypothetical protein